jgi:hypothetical protein
MQVWGGGPAFGQRLADRQGVHHRGENRVSSHTNLHTNLPISVRKCARGTRCLAASRSRPRPLLYHPEAVPRGGRVFSRTYMRIPSPVPLYRRPAQLTLGGGPPLPQSTRPHPLGGGPGHHRY